MHILGNKTAAYLRLSRDDGDKQESDSIRNQRELIKEYLSKDKKLNYVGEYVDDGYSGTSFDRPSFQRLMGDVKAGKVNCIVVKDLSRLGRNYIETGRYIEQVFPLLGVRFIAILDHYDSAEKNDASDWLVLPFKNLINDAFARDISTKIRSQLDVKRKNGKFIGSFACYGYQKDPEDVNRLIIDPYAAEIVRSIYRMKLSGYSSVRIADELNHIGVLPPAEYQRHHGNRFTCGFHRSADPKWEHVSVTNILKNEMYTGTMVQGRHSKISYKMKESRTVPKEEWIRVEKTHDAIIEKPIFDEVQRIMRFDTRIAPNQKEVYPLSGLVFCGGCGQNMVRKRVKQRYSYFHCNTHKNGKGCSSHQINVEKLEQLVLQGIQTQAALILDAEAVLKTIDRIPEDQIHVRTITKQIQELEKEIERFQKLKTKAYVDMLDETISKDEYEEINRRFTEGIGNAVRKRDEQLEAKARLLKNKTHQKPWIEAFRQYRGIQSLDRCIAVTLIERILVYSKKHIEIVFRFQDEMEEMLRLAEAQKELVGGEVNVCAS